MLKPKERRALMIGTGSEQIRTLNHDSFSGQQDSPKTP